MRYFQKTQNCPKLKVKVCLLPQQTVCLVCPTVRSTLTESASGHAIVLYSTVCCSVLFASQLKGLRADCGCVWQDCALKCGYVFVCVPCVCLRCALCAEKNVCVCVC